MYDTQITTMDELRREQVVAAQVDGIDLVVLNHGDEVDVYAGRCPHQGRLLSEGHIEDGQLVCAGHGWRFDCASGVKVEDAQTCLHQFSVAVDGEQVLVNRAEIIDTRTRPETAQSTQATITPDDLPGPSGIPILGNAHQIKVERFHLLLEEWHQEFGDMFKFKIGPEQAMATAVPEMIQQMMRARPDSFSRLKNIRKTIEEMGVNGLFAAEGEQWYRHRQIATSAFDVRHLREFFPTMVRVTQRLHNRWQKLVGSSFDAQEEMMRYTVDITTNLAFGYDMNTLEADGDRIQQHLEHIFPMLAYRAFFPVRYWNYIKFPADRKLEHSLNEIRRSVETFIANAREQMAQNPTLKEKPENLLQALLVAQANEDVPFSDDEIYGNVITFLLAGEDTTANSIAWMLYHMTQYPDVQRQMQAESDAVLGDDMTITDYDTVNELRYIEAVTHETMRFNPVASFLGLQALKDVQIAHVKIPKGMPVFVLLRPKTLVDSEFPEAQQFKPERWIDYTENPHQRKSFSPFGGGPRLCPGRSLALLEIKMAMSMICRHFDVSLADPNQPVEEKFVFTIMPDNLAIKLSPRG